MKQNRKPTELPEGLKAIDVTAVLRRRGVYIQQLENKELKRAAIPIARQIVRSKATSQNSTPRRHAQFSNDQIQTYWEKQIHIVEVVESQFENKLKQFIENVTKQFLTHLDTEVNNQKSFVEFAKKDYFSDNEDNLVAQAEIDFTPLLQSVAVIAGQNANKLIGVDEPYLPHKYQSVIRANVRKFTHSMLDTDREALVGVISNGLQDGLSIPEIRSQIETKFDEYSRMQAQRIGRTEVLRASNQASLDAFEQSGIVEGKQWVTFGAMDECAAYDGQIVTLSDSFYGSDNEFQDGDPPLHPNCRCVIVPIVENVKNYKPDNTALVNRVKELEAQIDKRTKAYKSIREGVADDRAYIKALESHLGVSDE